MNRPLVAFDTETANLRGAPHLVELGAVRFVDGESVEHFERLVCPPVPVEPEARAVHGLGDDELRAVPEASEVLAEFRLFVGDDWLVAHNAKSDAHVLGFEYARCELAAPTGPVLDSLALARHALPDAPDHKLATLAEFLALEHEPCHRALPDAVACWQVVEAAIEHMGGWNEVGEAELLKRSGIPQTLATAGPERPRRHRAHVRRLERARLEGERVELVYGDTHDTPARLGVYPRLLYRIKQRSYLEGECASSGTLKTYRLDRVQRVETSA